MNIPIFYINLEESTDRAVAMQDNFLHDVLIRFEAIAGEKYDDSVERTDRSQLISREIACAQSHIALWKKIVKEDIDCAIILEDDVKPVDNNKSILFSFFDGMNNLIQNFDVLFLQKNFDHSCDFDREQNYTNGRGCHSYAITKHGAAKSIFAMTPIVRQLDLQWPMAFKKTIMFSASCKPEKNIEAKVLKNGIIEHSSMAAKTTFTISGEKYETDSWFKGGYK